VAAHRNLSPTRRKAQPLNGWQSADFLAFDIAKPFRKPGARPAWLQRMQSNGQAFP
jgi:hypothetical protein